MEDKAEDAKDKKKESETIDDEKDKKKYEEYEDTKRGNKKAMGKKGKSFDIYLAFLIAMVVVFLA